MQYFEGRLPPSFRTPLRHLLCFYSYSLFWGILNQFYLFYLLSLSLFSCKIPYMQDFTNILDREDPDATGFVSSVFIRDPQY